MVKGLRFHLVFKGIKTLSSFFVKYVIISFDSENQKSFNEGQMYVALSRVTKLKNTCALRDLVPFVQFKKREKHLRKSVNFSKVAG